MSSLPERAEGSALVTSSEVTALRAQLSEVLGKFNEVSEARVGIFTYGRRKLTFREQSTHGSISSRLFSFLFLITLVPLQLSMGMAKTIVLMHRFCCSVIHEKSIFEALAGHTKRCQILLSEFGVSHPEALNE